MGAPIIVDPMLPAVPDDSDQYTAAQRQRLDELFRDYSQRVSSLEADHSLMTTKGDLLSYSTEWEALPVGTDTYVLTADAAEATGLKWAAPGSGSSPLTTKGDVYTYSTVDARLGVGTDGDVLTAASGETTGLKWATPVGQHLYLDYITDETTIIVTNMAAAQQFFLNTKRYARKIDLTNVTQVRFFVYKDATAGYAGSTLSVIYKAGSWSATIGDWSDIGTSTVSVAIDTTNTPLDSGFIALASGAKADVYVAVAQQGGNAVQDPAFGAISLEFK